MYKYCYIEPIIFTSYLIWYTGRIWNGYVASRFNRIGEIAEVLNSSMTEFFKKNDSVRARPDYLADASILFRQENPICAGTGHPAMVFRTNRCYGLGIMCSNIATCCLMPAASLRRFHSLFRHCSDCSKGPWGGTHDGYLPTVPIGVSDEDTAVSRKTRRMGLRNCTPVPFVPFHSQIGRKRYESRKMDTCGDCDFDRYSGWNGRVKKVEADFSASTVFFLFQHLILYGQRTEKRKMNLPNLSENFPLVHLI